MANRIVNALVRSGSRSESERGFTLMETAGVLGMAGLLLGPMLAIGHDMMAETRAQQTERALGIARAALIEFAAENNGCLPFAADQEGGVPQAGDTGIGVTNRRAGDLPWADLDLGRNFLDGNGQRLQYFVASQYVDSDGDPSNGLTCKAQARGEEWNPNVTYEGTSSDPIYVYYTDPGSGERELYKLKATLPAGTPPAGQNPSNFPEVGVDLPDELLQVRRGPDIKAQGSGSDLVSARNVFVLLAPGTKINANLDLTHIRDANHRGNAAGGAWPLDHDEVDAVAFAATKTLADDDQGAHGDDTLLAESFIRYKHDLNDYGLRMEPICNASC